mgnify:CR=1 FL=1
MERFKNIELFDTANNGNYLFLHNSSFVSSNVNLNSLNITDDIELTVYHLFDKDCNVIYTINQGVNAKITEVNHYQGNISISKEIIALENSSLTLVTIDKSNTNNDNKICVNVKTEVYNNAYINNMKLAIYKDSVKYLEDLLLSGKRAKSESLNVIINNCHKNQCFDLKASHTGIETESKMTNFGICKGKSVLDINTNGIVISGAKKSNINQKSKGILLDSDATISANPWLQIDDFDCLASHGAGIGAIDEEELYYLMSRGLTELESSTLIINGFINPVYEAITNLELQEKLKNINILKM